MSPRRRDVGALVGTMKARIAGLTADVATSRRERDEARETLSEAERLVGATPTKPLLQSIRRVLAERDETRAEAKRTGELFDKSVARIVELEAKVERLKAQIDRMRAAAHRAIEALPDGAGFAVAAACRAQVNEPCWCGCHDNGVLMNALAPAKEQKP